MISSHPYHQKDHKLFRYNLRINKEIITILLGLDIVNIFLMLIMFSNAKKKKKKGKKICQLT